MNTNETLPSVPKMLFPCTLDFPVLNLQLSLHLSTKFPWLLALNHSTQQNVLEGLLKHKLLGSISRVSYLVGL